MSHAFGPADASLLFVPSAVVLAGFPLFLLRCDGDAENPTNGHAIPRLQPRISSKDDITTLTTTNTNGTGTGTGLINDHGVVGSAVPARSFSSILSPTTAPISHAKRLAQEHERNALKKPFVYSRDFILSLYDEDKARRRPIDLSPHELATCENPTRKVPWALCEFRNGEMELFTTSIHPANTRARPSHQLRGADSPAAAGTATNTLDLASLGTLPRDRDRNVRSTPSRSSGLAGSGTSPSSASSAAAHEKGLGALGSSTRRIRGTERITNASLGITGGVLCGLGGSTNGSTNGSASRTSSGEGTGAKEVWQASGRWRRAGESEGEGDKPLGFGPRRHPAADSSLASDSHLEPSADIRSSETDVASDAVPATWDEDETSSESNNAPDSQSQSAESIEQASSPSQVTDADLTQHATNILGSLALDSDPIDDAFPSQTPATTNATSAANGFDSMASTQTSSNPPGFAPIQPNGGQDLSWQYRDPTGQIQGPFTPSMMVDWHKQGFFSLDLRVKRVGELDFETIESVVRRSGDRETFFLTAPLQPITALPPPISHAANGGAWPLGQASPGLGSQHAFGAASPFYEPFGVPASASPSLAHQSSAFGLASRSTSQSLDPWASSSPSVVSAALAAANGQPGPAASSWGFGNAGVASPGVNGFGHQLQNQRQPQSNADLFREKQFNSFGQPPPQQQPQQQQGQGINQQSSVFGQPQGWNHLNGAASMTPPAQPSWTSLLPQRSLELDTRSPVRSPMVSAAPSPVGPPAVPSQSQFLAEPVTPSPAPASIAATAPAPVEPSPVVEAAPVPEPVPAPAPAPVSPWASVSQPSAEKIELSSKTSATDKVLREAQEVAATRSTPPKATQAPVAQEEQPASAAAAAPTPAPQAPVTPFKPVPATTAPWVKEETTGSSGPSLREIQEIEARAAEKRKHAARIQAAQANIQAAQRAAALEAAEQLPATANWGASATAGSASAASATTKGTSPWSKAKATSSSGRTLKEIQEEEERRKKLVLQAQQSAAATSPAVAASLTPGRGYAAASASTAGNKAPAPWTTIAVKATPQAQAQAAKTIIPGLPLSAVKNPIKDVTMSTSSTPAKVGASSSMSKNLSETLSTPLRTSSARPTALVYDVDHPPPPSAEFMSWTRSALKGLAVPSLDDFITMLLSFPLEISEDVLEIISDSVYANSSILDGRRFANEFTMRRQNDTSSRYPGLSFNRGTLGPKSSEGGVKTGVANKEWSVKIAGGKKKKSGGK
ncbi:BQ2448_3860 [Microbotryum intermedium]|uniref:BQ2448_3860 protein n=1 Tax=Microbotryum intermedium TaxID=269621 RepID=A0A238FJZ3_9BASI|nr:BQ2448_3860 [Microbotryum intermedium]